MKIRKGLIITVLVIVSVVMCLSFTACGKKTLKGFDIDLAKAVFDDLGIKVEFVKISWDAKETELSSKNIDLIWNGLTINSERQEIFSIGLPYMSNKQVLVVKTANASQYTSANDLAGKIVAVESGSAGDEYIQDLKDNGATTINKQGLSTQALALMEVKNGTSDCAVIDSVMAGYYTSTGDFKGQLSIVDLGLDIEEYGIAARKADTGVTDKINVTLNKLYKNGKVAEIAKTYGLENEILDMGTYTSTGETAGWDYIQQRGKIIIGYTLFAPIAYEE